MRRESFPLNQAKSKGVHEVETQDGESSNLREVKAVITLRSGKEVDQPLPNLEHDEELMSKRPLIKESNNQEEQSGKKSASKSSIEEEPRIASPHICKVSKGLVHSQRGLQVIKNAFLTEQVSAIIQSKSPVKYKDPRCPTISVNIGGTHVEKALLDLGASVNLLPYSVYKQLGLGGLKPTTMTLSLADRSVKIPRGVIEDVLVQVDKFYYPVDFVRNGVMQLTFGNMTLELNIFHLCKRHLHPEEEEGFEEPLCLLGGDGKRSYHCSTRKTTRSSCGGPSKAYFKAISVDLKILRKCKKAIGWQISDLKGISPLVCTHHIIWRGCKTSEATPKETESSHARGGENEKGEEVSTRPTSGWRENALGLCNAPATFQRCMLSIFSCSPQMYEKDLVLNWEKCHFMVQQGIVLGHIISKNGIEVDKAKVELIVKLPPPTNVKGIRQFLGHAGFYRRFIKDFSKISKPLCELLVKDAKFAWNEKCQKSFEELKQFLTTAPIVRAPNWKLPFEVMCDSSDLAMGLFWGKEKMERPM
ncbi:Retrovirus-related Pol polyprotein from transposon 17.6 [Vitis vinifera]|uniref:Retrovirus-related Pol polyprotein from transposon 17.6 n=1 Tax=Vitis vinifera TaxID=29760 RepID=A0A438D6Z2_VITVI|nr:Retrovirus-related Pol polyprotein from transposon 17.6 [Vitis vinifera]